MSTEQLKIFVTGASGYIGGSVLSRLLTHKDFSKFSITALVRKEEKAALLEPFGVHPIVGSHDDSKLLEGLASEADVVMTMADCDNLKAAEAILNGLKKKFQSSGKPGVLIHTSGTGVFAENTRGLSAYETVYDDSNVAQIAALPITQIHRNVDLLNESADAEGYVKTYIVLPCTIYGIASNPLVEAGIQNPYSLQIPYLIRAALARGRAGMVGLGKNVWNNVHVDDVADLYIVLFNHILAHPDTTPHGKEGYYVGENGEHALYDAAKAVGKALVELGKSEYEEPTTLTDEEELKYFGGPMFGTTSRAVGTRSRSIGWKPKHTTKDLLASVFPEVQAVIVNTKA